MCSLLITNVCTDVRDGGNSSPLHHACSNGHKDVVEYLVEKANCDVSKYHHSIISCVPIIVEQFLHIYMYCTSDL